MTKKIIKNTATFIAILVLASQTTTLIPLAVGAGSASLSFGEATLRNGCPGSIPININTGGEGIWAADVAMTVNGSASIDTLSLGTPLPLQSCNDPSEPNFMLCGARQPGTNAYSGQGVYGTITITPNSIGSLSLSFNQTSSNLINDDIQNVLGTATGAAYTVLKRFNVEIDGKGFCTPDTTAPTIQVTPSNGKNNVPVDTSIALVLNDDRVGVDVGSLTFSVNGEEIDTSNFTKAGGTYTPETPFDLGEQVAVAVSVCDLESNCRSYNGSFRITPPAPSAKCGDKIVDEDEECDDGYQTATCDRDCTLVACGDGIINDIAGEQCDDFNLVNGDGCTTSCTIEIPVTENGEPVCPVTECQEAVCPELTCPVIEEETPAQQEDVITPPEPEVKYTEEEITEKAQKTVATQQVVEKTATTVELPSSEEETVSRLDQCKSVFPSVDFDSSSADFDDDGLSNKTECYAFTNPFLADTDGDGCQDGDEINQYASDPLTDNDCKPAEKVRTILITSPQPGWLISKLEISGLTPDNTSVVDLVAFPVRNGKAISEESVPLGTVNRFALASTEDQFFFDLVPNTQLKDEQLYDLVAIGTLASGRTITSPPIRFTMDNKNKATPPKPTSIGKVPIDASMKVDRVKIKANEDGKVEVTGESEYGAQVFAVWQSIVLASSVIADSAKGEFTIESPRPLEIGMDHDVTLFAVKNLNGQKLRSENVDVKFHISKPISWPVVGSVAAFSSAGIYFALRRRKKVKK